MELKYSILVKQLNKYYILTPERFFFSCGYMFVAKVSGIIVGWNIVSEIISSAKGCFWPDRNV